MKIKYIFPMVVAAIICLSWESKTASFKAQYGEFTDARDSHTYKTVKIGNQVWMAENFAYLPYICPPDSANCGIWVYNYPGTDVSGAKESPEYTRFGGLYSWEAAKKLAPAGWHLPGDEEWKELERHLGIAASDIENKTWRGANNEANRLKENGDTGFKVLFGGWMTDYGKFNFMGQHANFWCATEVDPQRGFERLVGVNNGRIGRDAGNKGCGFSVRYIKDQP
jgi:uncharacterized protein (TIGR02145 family)